MTLSLDEIKERVGQDGTFQATVKLTWMELVEEDHVGINNLISERICGDPGLLCGIEYISIQSTNLPGDLSVELTVQADPRLLLRDK